LIWFVLKPNICSYFVAYKTRLYGPVTEYIKAMYRELKEKKKSFRRQYIRWRFL